MTGESRDAIVNRFFGIFFLFFQLNSIFGSLISSFVLSSADTAAIEFPSCYNASFVEEYCGAADGQEDLKEARLNHTSVDCPVSQLQGGEVGTFTLYLLMSIYVFVGLSGAALVALFVDNIETRNEERENKKEGSMDLLVATFRHMKDRRQILLIPITMYSGFEQAFIWSDYTRSFVTCPLAVNWVGFVLVCFGVFDSTCSYVFGKLERVTGRIPLFSLASIINVVLCVVMLSWIPFPDSPLPFFAIPAGWGIADAVWQTQLNAFYGVLFMSNKEAAFSNYRLWESLGFVCAFAYQNHIRVTSKLVVLLVLLPLGMICYFVVEHQERAKRKRIEMDGGHESQAKLDLSNGYSTSSSTDFKKDNIVTSI